MNLFCKIFGHWKTTITIHFDETHMRRHGICRVCMKLDEPYSEWIQKPDKDHMIMRAYYVIE